MNGCLLSARFSLGEAIQKHRNLPVGGVFLDILLHNSRRLVSFYFARSFVETMAKCSWNACVWISREPTFVMTREIFGMKSSSTCADAANW